MKSSQNASPIKKGWSYKHEFGIIAIEGWGDPFLIITENKFWNGQSWGYNYYKLGINFADVQTGQIEKTKLNNEYNLPEFYSSKKSEDFLVSIAEKFPYSRILKS